MGGAKAQVGVVIAAAAAAAAARVEAGVLQSVVDEEVAVMAPEIGHVTN
jgi:hypothetical protein